MIPPPPFQKCTLNSCRCAFETLSHHLNLVCRANAPLAHIQVVGLRVFDALHRKRRWLG